MDPIDQLIRRLHLRDLRIFIRVVEQGSLAKAASSLSVSRPVVSKSLASLERTLGVRLIDRSPQGMAPTDFGSALLKRSIAAFDELRQGLGEVRFLADPNAGELCIGASEYMAAGLIPVVIDRLSRRYSELHFKVELTDPVGQLRERRVEFVVARLLSAEIEPDLETELLFHERVFVAAGPANKWVARRKIGLADLRSEPWILAPPEIASGSPIVTAFQAVGLSLPRTTVLGLSLPLRNGLLATGRFLTIVPGSVMRFGAERMLLKALPIELAAWDLPVAIVTMKNRALSTLARMFIDEVRETARTLAADRVGHRRRR